MYNKTVIEKSQLAGCYYCCCTFQASEVYEYVDENDDTALCPKCGIDTVLGDATGLPITNQQYLEAIHQYGFGKPFSKQDSQ